MKAQSVLMILFLLSFAVCKSQNSGTYIYPLTIQVKDSTLKELGYFKYNPSTNTVSTRGVQKWVWQFYYQILSREAEITGALKMIAEQINDNGEIIDIVKFKQAVSYYAIIKQKYGM
jgi:hypothetical protein